MENNIYKKLLEVRKAGIKLQRDTKAYNYKYATLSQIQEKLGAELEKQGLLVIHSIVDDAVVTSIIDTDAKESTQMVQSSIKMTEGIKPQDKGSEITYYRRYNLLSLLDLEVEDDDGVKAQESKKEDTKTDTPKVWLNYDVALAYIDAGNTTAEQFKKSVLEDGYTISKAGGEAMKHYFETGNLVKDMFFKK